eukprot:jgi/Mesen1/5499/ME000276S04631
MRPKQVLQATNRERRLYEEYSEHAIIFYPGNPPRNKRRQRESSLGTKIQDLPDDVLTLILESAWRGLGSQKVAVCRQRKVCRRWRKLVNYYAKTVSLERVSGDVGRSLRALVSFTTATQVKLRLSGRPNEEALLRGLATGFPHVRAFDFAFPDEGWRALPGLFHFLSRRTSLEDLSLSFPSLDFAQKKIRALMDQVDFSRLVHLKTLTLRFEEMKYEKDDDCLPLSRSILALPQLQAFHLHVEDMRRLPLWLGELGAFASLSVFVGYEHQKPFNPAPLRTLQALELHTVWRLAPEVLATIVHALPALTSLQANRFLPMPTSYGGGYEAGGLLLRPGLRRLHLAAMEIPPLPFPQVELADLWLRVSDPTRGIQRDLFAFTPALQHLHLDLFDARGWPDFRLLPARLASLTLTTGRKCVAGERKCAVDIRHLSALQKLHLSCGVLPALVRLPSLRCHPRHDSGSSSRKGGSTSSAGSSGRCQVTVQCDCHVDERTPWMEEFGTKIFCCRFFKRYRQYAGDAHPCRFMPPGMARQLFPDAGFLSSPPAGPEAPVHHVACSSARRPDTTLPGAQLQQQQQQEEEEEEEEGTSEHAGLPPPRRLAAAAAEIPAIPGPMNERHLVGALRALVEDLQARAEGAHGEGARARAEAASVAELTQRLLSFLEESAGGRAQQGAMEEQHRQQQQPQPQPQQREEEVGEAEEEKQQEGKGHPPARGRPSSPQAGTSRCCSHACSPRLGEQRTEAAGTPASTAPPGSAAAERQPEGAGSWRQQQQQQQHQEAGEGGGTLPATQVAQEAAKYRICSTQVAQQLDSQTLGNRPGRPPAAEAPTRGVGPLHLSDSLFNKSNRPSNGEFALLGLAVRLWSSWC